MYAGSVDLVALPMAASLTLCKDHFTAIFDRAVGTRMQFTPAVCCAGFASTRECRYSSVRCARPTAMLHLTCYANANLLLAGGWFSFSEAADLSNVSFGSPVDVASDG